MDTSELVMYLYSCIVCYQHVFNPISPQPFNIAIAISFLVGHVFFYYLTFIILGLDSFYYLFLYTPRPSEGGTKKKKKIEN